MEQHKQGHVTKLLAAAVIIQNCAAGKPFFKTAGLFSDDILVKKE